MSAKSQRRAKILVTGGTGFLGQKVIPLLREKFEVFVISRSGKTEVQGDLCRWNAGLSIDELKAEKFDIFLHMAGLYNLSASHADAFQQNISATGTALKIADLLDIPVFMNTSSVAAGINSTLHLVKPYDLNFSHEFPDAYSESKALGEKLIQNWDGKFRLKLNFRLGVLVGDSNKGEIERIDGPYNVPYSFERLRGLLENFPTSLPLPGEESSYLPLVPVDAAAKAIVTFCNWALETDETSYKSFHVTPKNGVLIRELYTSTLKSLAIRNKGVLLVSKIPNWVVKQLSSMTIKLPKEELNYLFQFPVYDAVETRKILGETWCPEFKDYERAFWSGYEKYLSNRRN